MGRGLFAQVLVTPQYRGLTKNARTVLLVMAELAHDSGSVTAPQACYYGGWKRLAWALGYPDAERGSSGQTAVKRAVTELGNAGLVEAMGRWRSTTHDATIYQLHLGGLWP